MAVKKEQAIEIRPIEMESAIIELTGDSPLIVHAWSEKAKRMMLEAQMGKSKGTKKEHKNPMEDFINSMYWVSEKPEGIEEAFDMATSGNAKFGFPVTGFKQAAISAAYRMGWAKDKVSLRGVFFLDNYDGSDMAEIFSDAPVMREDMVRVGMGTADIRYRGEFRNWKVRLRLKYNKNGQYSMENILNIINAGGVFCGVGEWRPEKDGQFGMYHISAD